MIKFYKDIYSNLSSLSSGANNICFATDRQLILMGGKEYGKDQVKVVAASSEIATAAGTSDVGTLYFVTDEQAVYQKTAGGAVVVLSSVTTAVSDLEAKLSTAYAAGKVVLGTTSGITSSAFIPDTTSGNLALTGDALSTTLVNAATLKTQVEAINQANATVAGGNGIAVTTGTPGVNGTEYTVAIDLGASTSSSLKIDENGKLVDDLKIAKITTTTGYAASYALQTGAGVQLGETINIVKDQFLSAAELVTGTMTDESDPSTFTSGGAGSQKYIKLTFEVNTDGTVDHEETSIVYVNVNDLVDVYTATGGVTLDTATNTFSGVVDPASEAFLTVGANGFKVSGVADAIDADILALGTISAETDKFITEFGVQADGTLSAAKATPHASGVTFTSGGSLSSVTVQAAIEELAADVAGGFSSLSASEVGGTGKYITTISETDGIISATAEDLTADKVAYTNTAAKTGVDDVSGALDDVYDRLSGLDTLLSGLDYGPSGVAGTPATGTPYTIINTIQQTDGLISATTVDMTAANTYQDGVTEALSAGTTAANARVGITSGTQASANDQFSNLIADYCSFHDASGNLV